MATLLLYAATVLIWGSTWIMVKYQLGEVAPAASLTYRYFLAGVLVLAGARWFGKQIRLGAREHLWCAAQGGLMFSVNYWLTYLAAEHLTTGIISVFFAGTAATTMGLTALMLRRWPARLDMIGALMGVVGIALVFWPEVAEVSITGPEIGAAGLILLSVFMFSVGGLVGARNQSSGMPRFATVGWAMVYGGVWMACVTQIRGESFGFELSVDYIASLAWLIVMGSGLVFVLYFTVVERIGAEKASYATVLFPLVALTISTFAEDYQWPEIAVIGVPLALIGNGLVLWKGGSPAPGQRAKGESEPVEWPLNPVDLPEDGGARDRS